MVRLSQCVNSRSLTRRGNCLQNSGAALFPHFYGEIGKKDDLSADWSAKNAAILAKRLPPPSLPYGMGDCNQSLSVGIAFLNHKDYNRTKVHFCQALNINDGQTVDFALFEYMFHNEN